MLDGSRSPVLGFFSRKRQAGKEQECAKQFDRTSLKVLGQQHELLLILFQFAPGNVEGKYVRSMCGKLKTLESSQESGEDFTIL
jgi:hypothetical protein